MLGPAAADGAVSYERGTPVCQVGQFLKTVNPLLLTWQPSPNTADFEHLLKITSIK